MDDEIEKLADEFAKAFTRFSDLEGAIIRGHILIEQALNRTIELTILNKDEYKADRFSFSQKVILYNMLTVLDRYKVELNILNKLRNQIAHSLEFDKNYVDIIINEVKKKDGSIFEGKDSKVAALITAISFICGGISVSHEGAKLKGLYGQLEKLKHSD